jgi:hypothetical protein
MTAVTVNPFPGRTIFVQASLRLHKNSAGNSLPGSPHPACAVAPGIVICRFAAVAHTVFQALHLNNFALTAGALSDSQPIVATAARKRHASCFIVWCRLSRA